MRDYRNLSFNTPEMPLVTVVSRTSVLPQTINSELFKKQVLFHLYHGTSHAAHQVITNLAANRSRQDCDFDGTDQMTRTEDTQEQSPKPYRYSK